MRIIVTGGAGFIGSHLCRALLNEGHEVYAIDDMSVGDYSNIEPLEIDYDNFHFLEQDFRNYDSLEHYFRIELDFYDMNIRASGKTNIDMIYHLGARGETYWCQQNPTQAVDVNVNGTLNMLKLANYVHCKNFVFMDTSAEYDGLPERNPLTGGINYPSLEQFAPMFCDDLQKISPKGIYSITKMCASQFVRSWVGYFNNNFTSTIFRPFNVYGESMNLERDIPPVIGAFIKELSKDLPQPKIYGDGEKRRDFIHISDCITLLMQCLDIRFNKGDSQTFNMGTGVNSSINEIYEMVCENWFESPNQEDWISPIYEDDKSYEAVITLSDCIKTKKYFDWSPKVTIEDGIKLVVEQYKNKLGFEKNEK